MKTVPQYPEVKIFRTNSSPILQIGNVIVSNILAIKEYIPSSQYFNEFVIIKSITDREFKGQIEEVAFPLEYPLRAIKLIDKIFTLFKEYEEYF